MFSTLPKISNPQYNPADMSRQTDSPALPIYRISVTSSLSTRIAAILSQLPSLGVQQRLNLKIIDLFFVEGNLPPESLHKISQTLLSDPVTDQYNWQPLGKDRVTAFNDQNQSSCQTIEVILRPGVTDNVANELLHAASRLGFQELKSVATGKRYEFSSAAKDPAAIEGCSLSEAELHRIAKSLLVNDTIQLYTLGEIQPDFVHNSGQVIQPELIDLSRLDEAGLLSLSAKRRLALDLAEMRVIQDYFKRENRPATDAELETIAQTWSEHCVHKTFRALIQVTEDGHSSVVNHYQIDNLLTTYLRSATEEINAPWVRSAFVDNAGVIEFDEETDLSFKVETHNHPSAIEPFGGANTGTGGVVRDILGVSHRPIAATDVLCFGPADLSHADLPPGVLHPTRIRSGVVAGIEDYGNKLGLPTVNGAVYYHEGYTSNPLVYCGAVGIGPRGCHPAGAQPGDRVIVIGGRTGRDGLRGATFSSLIMDAQTGEVAGASVQIGDPITEKGTIEVIERARDAKLYNSVTDCGAGGLSSAVGEMGEKLGVCVDLSRVPLKYAGLAPWEIWLSEAQERMVLAVPPQNLEALAQICETYWVEWSDIGEFIPSSRLQVRHGDIPVVDLENGFLHICPRRELKAVFNHQAPLNHSEITDQQPPVPNYHSLLLALLSDPNIATKEAIIRVYDHEVRGSTIVKPLAGPHHDGPSDAAVLKPLDRPGWRGFTLANGINPILSEANAYSMAVSVVDEAVRNAVAVGTDPHRIALLDNFCWGDPLRPETLGTLVQAAQGCRDAALHYGTPFISGKDSLNNEYTSSDGKRRAIPGTLLISSIGIHPDVRQAVTMDLKAAGNRIYLLGDWEPALAGSHALLVGGLPLFGNSPALELVPGLAQRAPEIYTALHTAIHAGLVRSAHDLSEGGLAVAAAEMALAGRLGLVMDVSSLDTNPAVALFAETNGCFLVEVSPMNAETFEAAFKSESKDQKLPFIQLGSVTAKESLEICHGQSTIINLQISDLLAAFKVA
jgi:phosphoribosylformylglycinamidine synthase II